MILDAASWGSDIELAFGQNEEYMCLYSLRGADQELEGVAPYLFRYPDDLKKRTSFDAWLRRKYDDRHRAFYLYSDCSLQELRRHLAVFTRAYTESGKSMFFRFYDPAVASYMYPLLTDKQAAMFFEKVEYIAYTDPRTDQERVVAPSGSVREYAKAHSLPKYETPVFSEQQMQEINRALQEYNRIEPVPVTCHLPGRVPSGELPLPVYDKQSDARVKVGITVDRTGKVTKAVSVQEGTLLNFSIKKAAEAAALQTVFDANDEAPAAQVGTIIYRFGLID